MSACVIDGCDRPCVARGLCPGHYSRERKRGNLAPLPRPTLAQRFWSKVNKTEDCWLWTAAKVKGYGRFSPISGGRMFPAHRWAYEQLVGPIPPGLEIDHLCRVKNCVRPDHLEPVTHAENMRRVPARSVA